MKQYLKRWFLSRNFCLTCLFLLSPPLIMANIISLAERTSSEGKQIFHGFLENPHDDVVITNVVLKLSVFQDNTLIYEKTVSLSRNVFPLAIVDFTISTELSPSENHDRFIVDYDNFSLQKINQITKFEISKPSLIKYIESVQQLVYSVYITNIGESATQDPSIALVIFDQSGNIAFYQTTDSKGLMAPSESRGFLLKVPDQFPLEEYQYKISFQN